MKRYIRSSDGIILDKKSKFTVASQIALNIEAEWDAIEGYQKLLEFFEAEDDQDAIDHVREIISDELNHAELLREIIKRYDGGIETAKD